jgi:hypothetical protein
MIVVPGRCVAGELSPGRCRDDAVGVARDLATIRDAISPRPPPHASHSFSNDWSTIVDFNLRAYGLNTPKTSRSSPILF